MSLVKDAETLWNYLAPYEPARAADVLLVLGSVDVRIALYAAQLTRTWQYACIVFSGGKAHQNDLLTTTWGGSEAEHFYDEYRKAGGKIRNVLLETAAQNTGENATCTYRLLVDHNVPMPKTMQIVTKPYMLRRARATFEKQWPVSTTRFYMTAPRFTLASYVDHNQPLNRVLNIMVGDMQRIIEYPKLGLQTQQLLPASVLQAYENLRAAGYTEHQSKY